MKWIKFLALLILISSGIYYYQFTNKEIKKTKENQKIIEQYHKKGRVSADVLGIITLCKTRKSSVIKRGNVDDIISKNQVASLNQQLNVKEDIYLAGHSIPSVFGDLHQYQVGNQLLLTIHHKKYYYDIYKIEKILIDDFTPFLQIKQYPRLLLMTCTNDSNVRLLVYAKLTNV